MASDTLLNLRAEVKRLEEKLVLLVKEQDEAFASLDENENDHRGETWEAFENAAMNVVMHSQHLDAKKETLDLCEKVYSEASGQ